VRIERLERATRFGLLAALALGHPRPAAANESGAATALNYDVDTALTYIDALSRPSFATSDAVLRPAAVAAPRTLGLRRAKLTFDWQAMHSTDLRLVLRPDAVNRQLESGSSGPPPREFDDRTGDQGMQPTPTIRLLDAYQLSVHPSANVAFGVGVWEGLSQAQGAYPELLGFGLAPLFPAKFSALRFGWQTREAGPDTVASNSTQRGWRLDLYVLQGNEDRSESSSYKEESGDKAPTAHDPYHGSAIVGSWSWSPALQLNWVLGYANGAEPQGSYDETYGEFGLVTTVPLPVRAAKLSLDSRFQKNRGHAGIADQTLMSAGLTASVPLVADMWYLLGLDYGKGDRWRLVSGLGQGQDADKATTLPLQGFQVQTGVLNNIGENLTLQLMFSFEQRQTKNAEGGHVGGFFQQSPNEPGSGSSVRRMGLELTYRLNQNA